MCYKVADGVAVHLDTLAEVEQAVGEGFAVFGSLAGAVYYGGVTATPFDRAITVERLYDGKKGLGIGTSDGRSELHYVGSRAAYQVVVPGRGGIDMARVVHAPVGGCLPADARLIAR